jgi:aspartyl-tRNA synthetase
MKKSPSSTAFRSGMADDYRAADAGAAVILSGWVHRRRDLGGLIFLDLRDRSGRIQLSLGPDWTPADVLERARSVGSEWVIRVTGDVVNRPAGSENPDLSTGEIEVHVHQLDVLAVAETPPIPVSLITGELPAEDLRLRYRYLDLRRDALQAAIATRHRACQVVRRYLDSQGFLEIETPMLTRRTPEGARDYLVPSRVHAGEFYALPQSPQIYKQLLMVSGFDRYFQIPRCLRDEDLRADRQPEFTQIDAEMSFIDENDIFRIGEEMVATVWREILGVGVSLPFPRLTYREAVERYGTDKPDLRFDMPIQDLTPLLQTIEFGLFQQTRDTAMRIRGLVAPGGAGLSRRELDQLAAIAKAAGAAGALWVRRTADGMAGQFAKAIDESIAQRLGDEYGMGSGDLLVVVIGETGSNGTSPRPADHALDALRRHLGGRLELRPEGGHSWSWITEFPLFDFDEDAGRLVAMHHPFTMPHSDDVPALLEAVREPGTPERARRIFEMGLRSRAYDAVYNGVEMASGSIRIHDAELQRSLFLALGIGAEEAQSKFGFLLEAFRFGVPPHGGFAFGFDRMAMLLVGGTSLRDVIAFPKTTAARALFEGAPARVSNEDLAELHISIVDSPGRTSERG